MERHAVTVALDARMTIDGKPVAFLQVSGEPLLFHHLDIVRKARVATMTTIYVPEGFDEQTRAAVLAIDGLDGIRVSTQRPDGETVTLRVSDIYVSHRAVRALKQHSSDLSGATICTLETSADLRKAEAFVWRHQKLVFSRRINMPAARALTLALRHTSITPNQITVASCAAGVSAAVCASTGRYSFLLVGAFLLQLALTLDLTDGYLARLTDRSTKFGNWLDTVVDEINGFAIIIGVVFGALLQYGFVWWTIFGALWLLSFHVIDSNFWLSRAFQLPSESAAVQAIAPNFGAAGHLSGFARRVLSVSQGLDSKYHVISVGLALNLTPVLIMFMGLTNVVSLIAVLAGRVGSRSQLD